MARGGRRPGAGRKAGVPNKATADVKALAREYTPEAIIELARLARSAKSEQARVAAIRELLDRVYGKAAQPLRGEEGEAPIMHSLRVEFVRPGGIERQYTASNLTAVVRGRRLHMKPGGGSGYPPPCL